MIDRKAVLAALLGCLPVPAFAGPPYETDDPQPTDRSHWEIYVFGTREGSGTDVAGAYAVDLNYGPVDDVQLTSTLPIVYARGSGRAFGDVELGIKYRFFHNEKAGVDIAIFPRVVLPTAVKGFGTGRVAVLLPVWAQKSFGPWAIFGGGGYTINPGPVQCNFAAASIAVTRTVSDRLSIGVEATRTGPDAVGTRASSSLGLGATLRLTDHFSLLAAGGPTFEDGNPHVRYHLYTGLGIQF